MGTTAEYPFSLDQRWSPLFKLLGVSEGQGVDLTDDGQLRVTYGRKTVETPISNVDHTEITGPHRWYTSVGLRLSFADDGITFGTNNQHGLCIALNEKLPRVIGFKNHSALWVSVADPEGLAAALANT